MNKTCVHCKESKSIKEFHTRSSQSDGLAYYCKVCTKVLAQEYRNRPENIVANRERARKWREANPEKAKATHDGWVKRNRARYNEANKWRRLRHRYGLSREAYENLMRVAGGVCELCGSGHILCLDHCHQSGLVRGILCMRCNTAMERFDEMPDFPARVVKYLEKHNGEDRG